jgi:predicted ABC-type ATPase
MVAASHARSRTEAGQPTTLAGLGHGRWLGQLRSSGYRSHLVFLALPSAALAVARVAARVREGGHAVPEDVVRRRYEAGLRNLFESYIPGVDRWQVYDNSDLAGPRLIASGGAGPRPVLADPDAWNNLEEHVT